MGFTIWVIEIEENVPEEINCCFFALPILFSRL